jgi:hypothetical protein
VDVRDGVARDYLEALIRSRHQLVGKTAGLTRGENEGTDEFEIL